MSLLSRNIKNGFIKYESFELRWMNLEPIIWNEVR